MSDQTPSAALTPIEGPTPAQQALADAAVTKTEIPAIEEQLYSLFRLVEAHMHPDFSGRYGALLQDIAEDQEYEGITYMGLMRSPNGTRGPGAAEGGLVRDMLRQWELWTRIRDGKDVPSVRLFLGEGVPRIGPADADVQSWLEDDDVLNDTVLQAIINDGLSRAWAHFIEMPSQGDGVLRTIIGTHESVQLLAPGAKALFLLQQRDILLDGQMIHLLMPNMDDHLSHRTALSHLLSELVLLNFIYPEG